MSNTPPKSKNFEIFPTSNSNNSKTKKSFEILKTPLNPACEDEQIGFFSFFLSPFPDLEKRVGSLNLAYFSRELLVKSARKLVGKFNKSTVATTKLKELCNKKLVADVAT